MSIKTKISSLSSSAQQTFLTSREVYMGLAMLMVVTYHATSRFHIHGFGHIFSLVSGVDIFMFFSGLGLCFSCAKHSLGQFYKRRFTRIAPLFLVMAIVSSVAYEASGGTLGVWGYVCNLTTLSYYHLGGCFTDWYLCSLFLFYLLFPIVFKNVNGGGIIILCLVSELIVLLVPMDWTYDCAVSRVGVFLLGVLFYRHRADGTFMAKSIVVSLVLCLLLTAAARGLHTTLSIYLFMSFFMPLLIVLFSMVINRRCLRRLRHAVAFVGRHSLEIYVANVLAHKVGCLLLGALYTIWADLLLTAAFAVALYYIYRLCLSVLSYV